MYDPKRPTTFSSNIERRKRDQMKIAEENQALLRRLQSRHATYSAEAWSKDYVKKEQLKMNISEFAASQHQLRPDSRSRFHIHTPDNYD